MNQYLSKKATFTPFIIFVALQWVVFFVSKVLPIPNLGIVPRNVFGLIGIVTSPFFHGDIYHLMGNTSALIVFLPLFYFLHPRKAAGYLVVIALMTGILTWLMARGSNHIGSSGVIFGLYGYLIGLGYFKKKVIYQVLSVILLAFYGGMLFSILPIQSHISWEGHLFGLVSGIIVSKWS